MDILYDITYYSTIILLPFVTYFLFSSKNRASVHSGRDKYNWFYPLKLYSATREVKKYQQKYKKRSEKLGGRLETEIYVHSDECADSQHFYGIDENGNSLSIKLDIGVDQTAEASLHLRLQNGGTYVFPGDTGIHQSTLPKSAWKLAGFNVEILEPFRKLRITFNGLLRNVSCTDYEKIEHVQFHFIFTSFGTPHYIPQDINQSSYAKAIASEYWRDGSWKENLADQFGFEHFGAMKGFIKLNSNPDETILSLPTLRSRKKGISDRFLTEKIIKIVVCDEYGNMFNITSKSFTNGCSQLNYGFAYLSTDERFPISKIELQLGENKTVPDCIKTNVVANKKSYSIVIHLKLNEIVKSFNQYDNGYEYYTVPAEVRVNSFSGTALVEFWYETKGKGTYIPTNKLTEKIVSHLPEKFVTDIKEEESLVLDLTGGKGNSLALLASLNSELFVVPDGFIVTVKAYRHHLSKNSGLTDDILTLNDICCGKIEGDLENSCSKVISGFKNDVLEPKVRTAIINQLKNYSNQTDSGWAVRSSAIGEDSDELSAAGQNDTFLGCQTEEDVLKAVSACWASLYTYQSVQYRWHHGLPVVTDMAVVVQKMVKSDSAGVLFTYHPSTSNPSEMVLTSNFGLGETVVSGESDPDTFTLNRTWDNKICVIDKRLGSKNKVLKATSSGLKSTFSTETDQRNYSITEKQAVDIGKVGVLLEEAFGNPRDIEWAFYKEQLYLLQSRPITTLNAWSDLELSHEMDTPLRTKNAVFTTANVKEVMPKPTTVLSQSTCILFTDWAVQKFAQQNWDPLSHKGIVKHQHSVFLEVISSIHKNVKPEVHVSSSIMDLAIFGHPVLDERINGIAKNRVGVATVFFQMHEMVRIMSNVWSDIVGQARELVDNLNLDTENKNLTSIYETISDSFEDLVELSICHSKTSAISVFYQIIAMNVLLEGKTELATEHMSDFAAILSSCEDVISAEVPKYLEEIAKIIKKSGKSEEFSQIKLTEGVNWLQNNCQRAYEVFVKFLERHGHRSWGEFEVMEESWRENPSKIISMIQANLKSERKKKETFSVDDVIKNLKSPQKSSTKTVIKFLMKRIRKAVGMREQTKSELVRGNDRLRQAYRILARQMVLEGFLPSKDLIYHLTHTEIGYLIRKRNPALVTKAIRRQKLYPKWQKLRYPEIMLGAIEPEEDSDVSVHELKGACKGTPVCTGLVQGRACVIQSLDEIDQLQTGDILITYSTDIGWSPYFPMLGGIVTELGGLVSHGAVVAREYGLPCAVGMRNVTKYFKTGDTVQLDGNKGEIGKI